MRKELVAAIGLLTKFEPTPGPTPELAPVRIFTTKLQNFLDAKDAVTEQIPNLEYQRPLAPTSEIQTFPELRRPYIISDEDRQEHLLPIAYAKTNLAAFTVLWKSEYAKETYFQTACEQLLASPGENAKKAEIAKIIFTAAVAHHPDLTTVFKQLVNATYLPLNDKKEIAQAILKSCRSIEQWQLLKDVINDAKVIIADEEKKMYGDILGAHAKSNAKNGLFAAELAVLNDIKKNINNTKTIDDLLLQMKKMNEFELWKNSPELGLAQNAVTELLKSTLSSHIERIKGFHDFDNFLEKLQSSGLSDEQKKQLTVFAEPYKVQKFRDFVKLLSEKSQAFDTAANGYRERQGEGSQHDALCKTLDKCALICGTAALSSAVKSPAQYQKQQQKIDEKIVTNFVLAMSACIDKKSDAGDLSVFVSFLQTDNTLTDFQKTHIVEQALLKINACLEKIPAAKLTFLDMHKIDRSQLQAAKQALTAMLPALQSTSSASAVTHSSPSLQAKEPPQQPGGGPR